MTSTKNTGTLLAQWTTKDDTFRLVGVGKFSSGYEDKYVVERLGKSALGEEAWLPHDEWSTTRPDDQRLVLLTVAIRTLGAQLRETQREISKLQTLPLEERKRKPGDPDRWG